MHFGKVSYNASGLAWSMQKGPWLVVLATAASAWHLPGLGQGLLHVPDAGIIAYTTCCHLPEFADPNATVTTALHISVTIWLHVWPHPAFLEDCMDLHPCLVPSWSASWFMGVIPWLQALLLSCRGLHIKAQRVHQEPIKPAHIIVPLAHRAMKLAPTALILTVALEASQTQLPQLQQPLVATTIAQASESCNASFWRSKRWAHFGDEIEFSVLPT